MKRRGLNPKQWGASRSTVEVAGFGAGVSGCCVGGASSLEEPTVYSLGSKSLFRPYPRCQMQRAMFLAFMAGSDQSPNRPQLRISSCARMAIARVLRRGMATAPMPPANARCSGPLPPDSENETAGRPPG